MKLKISALFCLLMCAPISYDVIDSDAVQPKLVSLEVTNSLQATHMEILFYNLEFTIDPEKKIFTSTQNVTIQALATFNYVLFNLQKDLEVQSLSITTINSQVIEINNWSTNSNQIYEYNGGQFIRTSVFLNQNLYTNSQYIVQIKYSINQDAITNDLGNSFMDFKISKEGSKALGWPSGPVAVFYNAINYAAPHRITLYHPNSFTCVASGTMVSKNEDNGNVKEQYFSNRTQNTSPSFSCAKYNTIKLQMENLTVEFFYFDKQPVDKSFLEHIGNGIHYIKNYLGDTGDTYYQFAFIDVSDNRLTAVNRRDTIFVRTGIYTNLLSNKNDQVLMFTLLFHELAHSWNGFVLGDTWDGNDFFLWYQEGGANFLSAWVCEMVLGRESASTFRKRSLVRYDEFKGINSQYTIKDVPNGQLDKLSDVATAYEYSGVIWEQLFLKLGNDTFFKGLSDFTKNFWLQNVNRLVTIDDLFTSFESYTEVNIDAYLSQWSEKNANIKMSISKTSIKQIDQGYENTIEITISAERDYEIYTSLGYKMDSKMYYHDVAFNSSGKHIVKFLSNSKANSFVIDPDYKVPRMGVKEADNKIEIVLLVIVAIVIVIITGFKVRKSNYFNRKAK